MSFRCFGYDVFNPAAKLAKSTNLDSVTLRWFARETLSCLGEAVELLWRTGQKGRARELSVIEGQVWRDMERDVW